MRIYPLSAEKRSLIWTQLTPQQKEVFNFYTMQQFTSKLLTRSFRISSCWKLISVNIDYGWDIRRKNKIRSGYQYCECGRPLKYQYEIEATNNSRRHLFLGSTHFAEHAGIPVKVAIEIRKGMNEIQIYMDEILYRYRKGERFPEEQFGYLFKNGVLKKTTDFNKKMNQFRDAGLPLFHVDKKSMLRLANRFKNSDITEQVSIPHSAQKASHDVSAAIEKLKDENTSKPTINLTNEIRQRNDLSRIQAGKKLRNDFKQLLESYLRTKKSAHKGEYVKVTRLAIEHIEILLSEYEKHGPIANDIYLLYFSPISDVLGMGYKYVSVNGQDIQVKPKMRLPLRDILHPILRLEYFIWKSLSTDKIPEKDWQLEQLRRIAELLRNETDKYLGDLTIQRRREISSHIRRYCNHLNNNLKLDNEASQNIQELYQLVMAVKPKAQLIDRKINQFARYI